MKKLDNVSVQFYEKMMRETKADYMRISADIVRSSDTKEEAEQRLEKIAKEAEEARDAYNKD